jgi:hypothetical protein
VVGALLCGIVLLVAGAWALGWIPPHAEYCEQNPQTQHKECATYHIALIAVWQIGKFLNAIAVALTALATVAIGYFTYTLKASTDKLWDAGERQLRHLDATAERQLRAYVLVSSAKVHDFGIERPPRAEVIIKNSGQTPAFDLSPWAGFVIGDFPLNIELIDPPPSIKKSQATLGAGDTSGHLTPAGRPLTKIEIDMIKSGTKAIYVFGEIKYQDIFKKTERTTHYRMMYGGGGGATPDGALIFCEEGNDAN